MRVSIGLTLAIAAGVLIAENAAHAQGPSRPPAECQTELKPTDSYRELSAMLKCLNDRIRALEGSRAPAAAASPRAATEAAPVAADRPQKLLNDMVRIEGTACGWTTSTDRNLICRFQVTNLSKEDVRLCAGEGTRAVVDLGMSYTGAAGFRAQIGTTAGNFFHGQKPVCGNLPPLAKIQMSLEFFRSRGQDEKSVQLLRLDCGPGCAYEVYKVPIN